VSETQPASAGPPAPLVRRVRWAAGVIWLVPIIAALTALSMVIHTWRNEGPTLSIAFESADGLEAGKTEVRYKDVAIGRVEQIELAKDRSHVVVHAGLDRSAESFATEDSRFWVVRPRIGTSGISGIGTLFSGAYIAADAGASRRSKREFVGLEQPPAIIGGAPGRKFALRAADVGSLDVGSPVYYRRIQVGRVVSVKLARDGEHLDVDVFVDAPYDDLVTLSSRFWNASGVDLSVDARGFKLNTQSLATVLAGGIAFQPAPGSRDDAPAPEGSEFVLYDDADTAMAPPNGDPTYLRMRFEQSLRGLSIGAPLDFHGVVVGKVVSIELDYDPATGGFPLIVDAALYPTRLGRAHDKIVQQAPNEDEEVRTARLLKSLAARGLRAQPRSGSLLTGQLYIALDFFDRAAKVEFDAAARPIELPTTAGSFDKLQEQLAGVVDKIDRIPFESIGRRADHALAALDETLAQVNGSVLPELTTTLASAHSTLSTAGATIDGDSALLDSVGQTLLEWKRTAQSVRELSDVLQRHPESLIRGVPADPPPVERKQDKRDER
jgi:paraquat-inducible protein B